MLSVPILLPRDFVFGLVICVLRFICVLKSWCDQGMTLGQQSVGHLGMGNGGAIAAVTALLCPNHLSPLQQNKGLRSKHLRILVSLLHSRPLSLCITKFLSAQSSRPRLRALWLSQ